MNMLLTTTDGPFGRVVANLHAARQTLSVERLWSPLPAGWENGPIVNEQHVSGALAIPARYSAIVPFSMIHNAARSHWWSKPTPAKS